jgi:hypothetical protein
MPFPIAIETLVQCNLSGPALPGFDWTVLRQLLLAIQTKIGVDGSDDPTSLEYRVVNAGGPSASAAWPVGSIFMAAVATNPSELLGFGTWEAFGTGRMPVGYDAADSDFNAAEKTGGAKTHTHAAHAYTPAGTNSAPAFVGNSVLSSSVSAGTPAGSNSAPAFTGTQATLSHSGTAVADHAAHTHSVTSNVSVAAHVFTQATIAWPVGVPTAANESAHTHSVTSNVTGTLTPAGTVAWPAGVPTHSGIAISDHASHTHTYTDVPNHVHVHNIQGGTTGTTTGTFVMGSAAAGGSARAPGNAMSNNTGGVASGTTAGPSATLSHTVSNQGSVAWPAGVPTFSGTSNQALSMTNNAVASGAGSAHTHTLSWPAGVPVNSGGAVDAHAVTNNAVTSGNPSATLAHSVTQPNDHTLTPQGTVAAPTFTGSALAGHTHTLTATGSVGAPVFTGTLASLGHDTASSLPPFITVFMWKRVA